MWLVLSVSLHVYLVHLIGYVFKMYMNLTIHYTKQFMIQNLSYPIHNLYHDSTTMVPTNSNVNRRDIRPQPTDEFDMLT